MPNANVQADGQTIIVPGAYYYDDVNTFAQTAVALVPPLVWLVYSYGGQPNVPQSFTTEQGVLNFLRGAPASDMTQWIFNPSNQLNGASIVTVIPVGASTQAAFTYKDNNGLAAITVQSANYGLPSNLLQTSVTNGSIAGVEITLFDGYSNASTYADNLGVPMQIAYLGGATGVMFSIAEVGGLATLLSTSGAPTGMNLSIPLGAAGYATAEAVAEYINGTGFYSAQILSAGPNYDHGLLPSNLFDTALNVALSRPVSGNAQFVGVGATLTDITYWMNTAATNYVTEAVADESSTSLNSLNLLPLTHFSGATSVPPTLSSYANALNVALSIPAWVVIADQNITGLPALLAQHAVTASSITQRAWRRAVSGSNIGDSIAAVTAMGRNLNAFQMTYCYPGIWRNNPATGVSTLYGGVYVAAAVAGIMAGNPVMTPLTNKSLVGNGMEVALTVPNIDTLQQAGILPVFGPVPTATQTVTPINVPTVPTIVSDFTTWQNDANPANIFNQQVAGRQYLAYVMQQALQPYTGTIESRFTILNQKKAAQAALNGQLVTPTSSSGVLNSWDNTSLTFNYNGASQLTSVQFACTFVGQNRFTVIEAFVQPLNLQA